MLEAWLQIFCNVNLKSQSIIKNQIFFIKSLINSVLDKTIERFKTNEINFNIQKLQLESMSLSLKSLFIESIEEIKKNNETEFSCLKTRSSYLDDKLETIEIVNQAKVAPRCRLLGRKELIRNL